MNRLRKVAILTTTVLGFLTIKSTVSQAHEWEIDIAYSDYRTQKPSNNMSSINERIYETFGKESKEVKWTENWARNSKYEDYDTMAYAAYKVGIINAPIEGECLGYRYKGDFDEFKYSNTESISMEKVTSEADKYAVSGSIETNFHIKKLPFKAKIEGKYEHVEERITKDVITTANTKEQSYHHDYTEEGTYFKQRRANFELYEVQVYEIAYYPQDTKKRAGAWQWDHFIEYIPIGYYLRDVYYTSKYVSDCGIGVYKYKPLDDGHFLYDGPIENSNYLYI
ncbi:MAG: hypothetical protein K6G28_04130 [Acholeplasmatales bacterium]|nr:hypothetical protein [Acholeplasmatales bacterium]